MLYAAGVSRATAGMMSIDCSTPFVLLDDARPAGAAPARLYRDPVAMISAASAEGVPAALSALDEAAAQGLHAAGFIGYEAGLAIEPRLQALASGVAGLPLVWFGLFERHDVIAADAVAGLLPDPGGAWAGAAVPRIARADYAAALETVQNYIRAGDIYQANLTFQADLAVAGDPLAIYAAIRPRAAAGYGGVVWTGSDWLLSFSPELFFAARGDQLTVKPMKGTARRLADPGEDADAIDRLRRDPKQRAENLMIVDLLRNDLSRIARPGSVRVPELFTVESYPTVHQMISRVTAERADGTTTGHVLKALFPCGSVTGAPKIRAMQIIGEIEAQPRGIYTGAIGRIDPDGNAAFNVAIRTLHLRPGEGRATLGLGSGIVSDSQERDEWQECLAKGAFVQTMRRFDLIETMRFDPYHGILLLDRHLARMKASAERFGFSFDRHGVRNELQAATFRLREPARIRLMVSHGGASAIATEPLPADIGGPVAVTIVPLPVAAEDFRLRHKTSDRRFYDDARAAAAARSGCFEVVFEGVDGFLTEGSFTSLFVDRGDGVLATPPVSRGLLPGVLRAKLIDEGRAVEADLTPGDLNGGFLIGNAVRGLLPARLLSL